MRSLVLTKVSLGLSLALLGGCTTLAPETVLTLREVVGTSLAGAKGATSEDQVKIDTTVARLCGGGVWNKKTCSSHNEYRNR